MLALIAVCVVFAIALIVLLALLWRATRRLMQLEADMAGLALKLEDADEEFAALLSEVGGSRIIIEVINPMTLARTRSRWGAALVGVAPRMIRRRVYDIVARELKERLAHEDVEAHVQIFHPTGA